METLKNTPVTQVLRNSLENFLAKDMKAWAALCADDVVAEFPFAPEGSPSRFEGRDAIYAYLKDYPSFIDVKSLPTLKGCLASGFNQGLFAAGLLFVPSQYILASGEEPNTWLSTISIITAMPC